MLTALLFASFQRGSVLTLNELTFDDYVVSLTTPGRPRMPNGIECAVTAVPGTRVLIGRGRVIVGKIEVMAGPEWNPVPTFERIHGWPAGPEPQITELPGGAASPAHSNDDLLAGYIAGLVLLHGRRQRAGRIAERAASQTSLLGATLLRHAARGEVPEPIHGLLAGGDPRPLLELGASGTWWLRGMVSAGLPFDGALSVVRDVRELSGAAVS
jgi:hypothetical protein